MLSVVGAAILIAQPEADALLFALVALFCVALVLVLAGWGALAPRPGAWVQQLLTAAVAASAVWLHWRLGYDTWSFLVPLVFALVAAVRRRTWWWALTCMALAALVVAGILHS